MLKDEGNGHNQFETRRSAFGAVDVKKLTSHYARIHFVAIPYQALKSVGVYHPLVATRSAAYCRAAAVKLLSGS